MIKYLFKRLSYMFVTLWVIITLTFFLMNTLPGDPIRVVMRKAPPAFKEVMRQQYGLDKPIFERYITYINELLHGNLGESIVNIGEKANSIIAEKFPVTARLGLQSLIIGLVFGLTLGILAAFHKNTWLDYSINILSVIGISVPAFVVAAILIQSLGGTALLPITGWPSNHMPWFEELRYTFIPTLALSFGTSAVYARYLRTSILDVINQDYILTAKLKGISKSATVWKHILRNAILPVVTIVGFQIVGIFTGSFVIETMFTIPGIGEYFVSSVGNRDYTMIMAMTIFFAFIFMTSQIIVDFLYVLIDPRIRITGENER